MNFGKFAMKLRYGQVAMKILRYGTDRENSGRVARDRPVELDIKNKKRAEALFNICVNLQFLQ